MQQITLKIHNKDIMTKLLSILKHFETDGVELEFLTVPSKKSKYTNDYVEKHWREIIMSVGNDEHYYKSEQYQLDYGNYLAEKYS